MENEETDGCAVKVLFANGESAYTDTDEFDDAIGLQKWLTGILKHRPGWIYLGDLVFWSTTVTCFEVGDNFSTEAAR